MASGPSDCNIKSAKTGSWTLVLLYITLTTAIVFLQELPIGRVVGLLPIGEADRIDMGDEIGMGRGRHLHAHQHPSIVGTVIAVVEQRNVPGVIEPLKELQQGAGPLGELEAIDHLVL